MAAETKTKTKPKLKAAKAASASTAPAPRKRVAYSPEFVTPFLDAIAQAKSTLEGAAIIGVNQSTIFDWLDRHEEFAKRYARAKEAAADFIVEEMLEIADDARNDFVENDKGHITLDTEAVMRSRLRIDTRKWLAAKLRPKRYGDALDLNHGVQPDNPLGELLKRVQGNAMPVRPDALPAASDPDKEGGE